MKQSDCGDLAQAITAAIGLPMAAHFKLITLGHKIGTKASAIHLMVADKDTKDAMEQLKQIYGKTQMRESATTFPLGQRLLLTPLASELNKKSGRFGSTTPKASNVLQRNHLCN